MLVIQKKIVLPAPPLDFDLNDEWLFIATKSNKVVATNYNLTKKKVILFDNNINRIIVENTALTCISNNKLVYKYDIDSKKYYQYNIRYDVSYCKRINNDSKCLTGLVDGKVMCVNDEFRPVKTYYGCKNRILDICDDDKDKLFVVDNKLNIIDKKTSKVQICNFDFVSTVCYHNKHTLFVGSDTGILKYDITKNKLIKAVYSNSPVSCIQIYDNKVIVGCENGTLMLYDLELNLLNELKLEGSVNFINLKNYAFYIGVGREEKNGSFSRNQKHKNILYKCIIT